MAAADAALASVRDSVSSTERAVEELSAALDSVKADTGALAEAKLALASLKDEASDARTKFVEAAAALKDIKASPTGTAESVVLLDMQTDAVKRLRDAAIEARIAEAALGAPGDRIAATRLFDAQMDQLAASVLRDRGAVPLTSGDFSRTIGGQADYERFRADLLDAQRAATGALIMGPAAGLTNQAEIEASRLLNQQMSDLASSVERERGAIPLGGQMPFSLGPAFTPSAIPTEDLRRAAIFQQRAEEMAQIPTQDLRDASRIGSDARSMVRDAAEADRVMRDFAGGGGGGGGYAGFAGRGFLGGILPGGARAGAGAVTTAVGLLAAAGPALGAAAAAALPAAAAGIESLGGAAGTLKLAFADLTAKAFTTQKGFDALTPVQQSFVSTLRQVDAGLMKNILEPLAQRTVLPGLTAGLRSALTPAGVGALTQTVGSFGTAIGGGAQDLGKLLGSPEFATTFGTVMQTNAGYLRTFIDDIGKLIDALLHLQESARPLTDWMAKVTTNLVDWIDKSVKAGQASGALATFWNDSKLALQGIGALLLSVGHLAQAFTDSIGGFKGSLSVIYLVRDAIQAIADILHQNRQVLSDVFRGVVASAGDAIHMIRLLGDAVAPVLRALDTVAKSLGGWRVIIDIAATVFIANFARMRLAAISLDAILSINPWIAVATAIAAAAAYVITHWQQVSVFFERLWIGLQKEANIAALGIVEPFSHLPGVLGEWARKAKDAITANLATLQTSLATVGTASGNALGSAMYNSSVSWAQKITAVYAGVSAAQAVAAGQTRSLTPAGLGQQAQGVGVPGSLSQLFGYRVADLVAQQDPTHAGYDLKYIFAHDPKIAADMIQWLKERGVSATQTQRIIGALTGTATTPSATPPRTTTPAASAFGTPPPFSSATAGATGMNLLPPGLASSLLTAQQNAATANAAGGGGTSGMTTQQARQALDANRQLLTQEHAALASLQAQHATGAALVTLKKEELTITREIAATTKQITSDVKAQASAAVNTRAERILGLGPGGTPTVPGVQALQFRERSTLLQELERLTGGRHHTLGAAASALGITPSRLESEPITALMKQIKDAGYQFSSATLDSLKKINEVLILAEKHGAKLRDDVRTNISDRLKQINDTLKAGTAGVGTNYARMSVTSMANTIPGLSYAQKLQLEASLSEAEAHGFRAPTGSAAGGVPLRPHVGLGYGAGSTNLAVTGDIVLKLDGRTVARVTREQLLKNARRNTTQTRGPNAGRNVGMS